jgi:hypothetical protein
MPYSSAAEAQMLDGLNASFTSGGTYTSVIAYASLHTAYSATGANELTSGSPAYARQAVTWAGASGPSKGSSSVAGAFNVPSGSTVAFVGLWSAVTSGTFGGMGPNDAGTQYAFTATLASPCVFTAPGSSYSNGNTVVLFPGAGGTLPTGSPGFVAGTVYYVVSASGATFELSATSGGSAINSSAVGSGIVQALTLETFGAQGTFTLSSETLSLA